MSNVSTLCHAPHYGAYTEPSEFWPPPRILSLRIVCASFFSDSHKIFPVLLFFLPRNPLGFHHCRHRRRQNTASQSSRRGLLLVGLREELRCSPPLLDWTGVERPSGGDPSVLVFGFFFVWGKVNLS